jgi:ATP-dependent Lon protease
MERNSRNFYSKLLIDDSNESNVNFIPILADDGTPELKDADIPDVLPIMALRDTVLFPGIVMPITVGREKSLKLIKSLPPRKRMIGVVAQVDSKIPDPTAEDLWHIGTVAQVIKVLEMPDRNFSVILKGICRFEVKNYLSEEPFFMARVSTLADILPDESDKDFAAIASSIRDITIRIINLTPTLPQEAAFAIKNLDDNQLLVNFVSANSDISPEEKQKLLEKSMLKERATQLLQYLTREVQMLELKQDIQSKVKLDLEQQQREYFLQQQIKTLQEELGANPTEQEVNDLKERAKQKKWSKEIAEHFDRELSKLNRMNPMAAEYSVQLNYVELLLDLPWNEFTQDNFDLAHAREILDEDHFGLEQVKERILEHLAVLKLKGDLKAPILCLYGPPGVGKTSLGKSVARALGRKYVRISLGGMHDEAEIRGHRKTYIGAMPGRIIQSIKKVNSSNPVIILDEIDKVGQDFHGDPASALLEALDPEQNFAFHDNFLEVEFDLSKVLFITTANSVATISPALRDRMEMIEVSGYCMEEKVQIAKRHLVPNQITEHGLNSSQLQLNEKTIEEIIKNYTRESGVRNLNQRIAKVVRNVAKKVAFEETYNPRLTIKEVRSILGVPRYNSDSSIGNELAGVVTGLAWTETGGEILFVETSLSKGKGNLTLTGNLGDVMKESAVLALEYIKAHANLLGINPDIFERWNVHVHVPEGAIPKDGPSAGITMVTSLASAFTQRKVKSSIAMTGEITLRGKVLPVGGIKEKILAAKRANIMDIILPFENKKDVLEINSDYIKGVKFHYVGNIMEALTFALLPEKVTNPICLEEPPRNN